MPNEKSWSAVAIKLLKSPVYKKKEKKEIWDNLLTYKSSLDEYFAVLGLRVFLETVDGYAFLEEIGENLERGMEEEDTEGEINTGTKLPHLIKKTPLSYSQSILCVLLRYEIEKYEMSRSESDSAIMRKSEIASLYRSFTKDKADEVKAMKSLDSTLRSFCRLTFLFASSDALSESEISDDAEFELSPILKAKIDTVFMKELLQKMNDSIKSDGRDMFKEDGEK